MAESHVVSGLVSKRAELAGRLNALQQELLGLNANLQHLDAAIKLFSPEFNLRSIKARQLKPRNRYFMHGEAQRWTLNLLRQAKNPMSSRQITDELMQLKSIPDHKANITQVQKIVIAMLHRLEQRKTVEQTDGEGAVTYWQVA